MERGRENPIGAVAREQVVIGRLGGWSSGCRERRGITRMRAMALLATGLLVARPAAGRVAGGLAEPPSVTITSASGYGVPAVARLGNASGGARTIDFSGLPWIVRSSGGMPEGPGPNVFADSTANVWVDPQGRLHLRITHRAGGWQCAEVFTDF